MSYRRVDGSPVDDESGPDGLPAEVVTELSPTEKPVPLSATILAVATVSGLLAAWVASGFAATLFNLPVEVWTFLLVWAATTGYVSFEPLPSAVLGRGFALVAALVVVDPLLSFGPAVLGGDGAGTVAAAWNLFVWGLGAAVVAGVFLLVARTLSRRAARLERRETRTRINYHR